MLYTRLCTKDVVQGGVNVLIKVLYVQRIVRRYILQAVVEGHATYCKVNDVHVECTVNTIIVVEGYVQIIK